MFRQRGNAALASSLRSVANVAKSSPEKLGKFYSVLEKAAEGGQASLAATHTMLLQKDPEYKKLIEPEQKGPGSMPIAPDNAIDRRVKRLGE
jgi:hypothetical protein